MSRSWVDLLGLARRAGKLVAGTERVAAAVRRRQVTLVVASRDLSAGSLERLSRLAETHGVRLVVAADCDRLDRVTGCPGRKVFGVTSKSFARAILLSW